MNSRSGLPKARASVITTSTGKYKFDNLAAGNYVVRAQLLSGKKFTTPSFYSIAVRAGMPYTRNFGLKAV